MTSASATRSTVTPADLVITPRDRRFGREEATPRWWHGANPYASAIYNALSATFPLGEAFSSRASASFAKAPTRGSRPK